MKNKINNNKQTVSTTQEDIRKHNLVEFDPSDKVYCTNLPKCDCALLQKGKKCPIKTKALDCTVCSEILQKWEQNNYSLVGSDRYPEVYFDASTTLYDIGDGLHRICVAHRLNKKIMVKLDNGSVESSPYDTTIIMHDGGKITILQPKSIIPIED